MARKTTKNPNNRINPNMPCILRMCILITAILICMLSFSSRAYAYENRVEVGHAASIRLHYDAGSNSFSLYKVADINKHTALSFTADFSGIPVDLNNLDSDGWKAAAETIEGYVLDKDMTPFKQGRTDSDGNLSWDGLETGLYLIIGEYHQDDTYGYDPEPALVSLPQDNNGAWDYDPAITLKYGRELLPDEDMPYAGLSKTVVKVWKDQKFEKFRPQNIQVKLLCDGEDYAKVKLNKENHWQHTWTGLEPGHKWTTVEELDSKSYQVQIEKNGDSFVITNTFSDDDLAMMDKGNDSSSSTSTSESTLTEYQKKLPQSGQLWWPVALMAAAGVCLSCIGTVRKSHYKK